MQLELSKIRTDGGTQSRSNLQRNIINEYAELMKDNIQLPPIIVFYDGENYWLADGFHRYWAKKQICENNEDSFLPEETIEAIVHQGTQRDAILFSLGANDEHGIRRTNEDKNRAVETMLRDNEWATWSDREIARVCKVSNTLVSKRRQELNNSTVNVDSKKSYKRDGKVQTMNTEKIGKHKITKEKEAVDIETGEIVVKNKDTLQLEEAIEQEIEETQRELAEQFDQDTEMPSYNVISEKQKLDQLEEQVERLKNQHDYTKVKLFTATQQVAEIIGFNQGDSNFTWDIWCNILDKLKEIMKLNNKVSEITETNNQLFAANENLTKELKEAQDSNYQNIITFQKNKSDLENQLSNVRLINEDVLELRKSNQMLKDQVSTLAEENNSLKESRDRLKLHIKPANSKQAEEMLNSIQSIIESALEKGKEKGEGIRIGRRNSLELLDAIKQARGVE